MIQLIYWEIVIYICAGMGNAQGQQASRSSGLDTWTWWQLLGEGSSPFPKGGSTLCTREMQPQAKNVSSPSDDDDRSEWSE